MRHAYEILVFISLSSVLFIPTVGAQTSYSVTISVQGLPPGLATALYVDSPKSNVTLGSGKSMTFSFVSGSVHAIAVDSYVNSTNKGTRYFISTPSWSFSGSERSHTFTYSTQYLLTIQTPYGSAVGVGGVGGGWYNSGDTTQVVLKDDQYDEGSTRMKFAGWTGGASGANLTSDKILMDSPKTAIAYWKTQFLLTLKSDAPNAGDLRGGGYYDSGTKATFSVSSAINANPDSRLRFSGWTGDYSGQSIEGTIPMDRPKVVTAHFLAQYHVTIQYDPSSISSYYNETRAGWYDVGSSIQLGPAPLQIDIRSGERLKFANWVDNGKAIPNFTLSVTVDKPHKIALTYTTQYYVGVTTSHGSVTGSGWYEKGTIAKITVTADSSWPVSYVFAEWNIYPSSGIITKSDDSWSLIVDRPYTVEARWNVDYLPLIVLLGGASATVVALVASIMLARKRGNSHHGKPIGKGRICRTCGSVIPEGAIFCKRCGPPTEVARPPEASLEDKVYDYIIKHEGVISLSKAASDLGLTVEQVREISEKLKTEGKLA